MYKYININIYIHIFYKETNIHILIQTNILSGNKYICVIQTNILLGNGMTNSMQATLSKAAIYTKQPTREWGDPYLTWGCANVLLRLYESERSNVLLLNMYESLWVSVRVVERGSVIEVAEGVGVRVVKVLWLKLLKVWEFCSVKIFSTSESSVRVFYC